MPVRKSLDRQAAEDIAVEALTLLTRDAERLTRFLALTGLGPQTIRSAAGSPGFLRAVLDHVAGNEDLLVSLANEMGVPPERIGEACRLLAPPGDPE